ncbi:MAG: T9SS type A sorting domain-containing protein, partial [candidate division WOR-3 bacterium]
TGGAIATHYYRGTPTSYAGIRYEGSYKLVYFGFPFEAVNYTTRYVQKPELLRRILLYFGEQLPYGLEEETEKELNHTTIIKSLRINSNPFGKNAILSFTLPNFASWKIELYTSSGQHISTLSSGYGKSGSLKIPADLRTGIYFLELKTPFGQDRIKVIKIKG